jgi:hypothetical protein
MTRYTVVWHPIAERLLAEIWLGAADRAEVSIASDAIDRELGSDALEKGRPVDPRFRRFVAPPLEAFYEVSERDRIVRVVHVRRTATSQFGLRDGNGR